VHLCEGGEGLDFLGFHHRWVRARGPRVRHVTFLARWPSRAAMQHARDRVRELTAPERLLLPVEQVVQGSQPLSLRGWAGYFRYGNSAVISTGSSTRRSTASWCLWPTAIDAHERTAGGRCSTAPRVAWA
jgi:hypothetical protein